MSTKIFSQSLKHIREICLKLPEAKEVEAWGHPTFRAGKKMFAGFGAHEGILRLGMKMSFARQDVLLRDGRFIPTPYAARQGWVSLRIDGETDWIEVALLLREAYSQAAIKRMLKALDDVSQD